MKQADGQTGIIGDDLIDENEAAAMLGISSQWLRCSRMRNPSWAGPRYIKISARRVQYSTRHLNEYLAARVIDPADRFAATA